MYYDEETPQQCYGCLSLGSQLESLKNNIRELNLTDLEVEKAWQEVGAREGHKAYALKIQDLIVIKLSPVG